MTHDAAHLHEDGFHEIQLSGKQLVFLFMATTILAVVIFLCGVQVGRNVRGGDRPSVESSDTVAAQSTAPPPASVTTQAVPSSGPPAAEPPPPAQEPDDDLSYAKRLQQAEPGAGDKLSPPPSHAASKPLDTRPAAAAPAKTSAPTPPPAVAAARPEVGPPAASASQAKPGQWIVQLSAIKDRGQAASLAHELVGKGYPAFVLDPAPGAPPIYRVQIGGYPDQGKADEVARRLKRDEHYNPYVRSR
ncbi:MAG TPA: SPOR domain-containing protein [Vicinamibacterales bacterium]|jgi:cell division septation protein DedD